jgi:hypothetical protein
MQYNLASFPIMRFYMKKNNYIRFEFVAKYMLHCCSTKKFRQTHVNIFENGTCVLLCTSLVEYVIYNIQSLKQC